MRAMPAPNSGPSLRSRRREKPLSNPPQQRDGAALLAYRGHRPCCRGERPQLLGEPAFARGDGEQASSVPSSAGASRAIVESRSWPPASVGGCAPGVVDAAAEVVDRGGRAPRAHDDAQPRQAVPESRCPRSRGTWPPESTDLAEALRAPASTLPTDRDLGRRARRSVAVRGPREAEVVQPVAGGVDGAVGCRRRPAPHPTPGSSSAHCTVRRANAQLAVVVEEDEVPPRRECSRLVAGACKPTFSPLRTRLDPSRDAASSQSRHPRRCRRQWSRTRTTRAPRRGRPGSVRGVRAPGSSRSPRWPRLSAHGS
jgi:hypothetical protein